MTFTAAYVIGVLLAILVVAVPLAAARFCDERTYPPVNKQAPGASSTEASPDARPEGV